MRPSSIVAFRATAILGFIAVVLGAAGAHGRLVHDVLVQRSTTEFWEKAVFYHFVHTVVMLTACSLRPFPLGAWSFFGAGILAFSGSLYALSFTTTHWLVFVTPLGGLCLLAGWLLLAAWGRSGAAPVALTD